MSSNTGLQHQVDRLDQKVAKLESKLKHTTSMVVVLAGLMYIENGKPIPPQIADSMDEIARENGVSLPRI